MDTPHEDALKAADSLIKSVKDATGRDYSKHRDVIALDLYDNGIWNGNYDSSTDLEDPDLPDLRLIQEDEYDQSMSDDEKPECDEMICSVDGGYLWEA